MNDVEKSPETLQPVVESAKAEVPTTITYGSVVLSRAEATQIVTYLLKELLDMQPEFNARLIFPISKIAMVVPTSVE